MLKVLKKVIAFVFDVMIIYIFFAAAAWSIALGYVVREFAIVSLVGAVGITAIGRAEEMWKKRRDNDS